MQNSGHRDEKLEVMITVDVESWPRLADWREDGLQGDLARDIYGVTPEGDFGIQYQVDLLKEHGLKGVFFVEALFACELGIEPLAKIVDVIESAGSEVQLHIHTEWFEKMSEPFLDCQAYNIAELKFEEQIVVIEKAIANLKAAGASNVIAYRAGNFGADFSTLKALAQCGIQYDSSYNYCYLDKGCGLALPQMLHQPTTLEGLLEVPVSCYRDYPGHYRPAQLCAVSGKEMQSALETARGESWKNFVIVSHSFELLRDRKFALPYAQPDWSVIQRFTALCEYLGKHQDRFKTIGFADMKPDAYPLAEHAPLHPPIAKAGLRTAARYFSQALRRLPRDKENRVRGILQRVGLRNL